MEIRDITEKDKEAFNKLAFHPLQSYEWGVFRKKTGVKVIRRGFFEKNKLTAVFQLTIHSIPHTPWTIGYLPKGILPTENMLEELHKIGKEEKCLFIQLEPNVSLEKEQAQMKLVIRNSKFVIQNSAHPLFTKYTFQLNLTKPENELLKAMHPKTRYNIKVAQKHGIEIHEDNSDEAFTKYWQLMEETTKRQQFFAHTKNYHELMWNTLKLKSANDQTLSTNNLTTHLFVAKYQEKTLTTFLLFTFHDILYYPYGASSNEYRNTMHSTLTMWEAIQFGKKYGCKTFDMWGALGENPDPKDPWYGFHRFKQGFNPKHVAFIGSYDLIINPVLYKLFVFADKMRWWLLR